jgi:hypothetical protein
MTNRATTSLQVHWVDRGYEPKSPPNPAFPKGVDIDLTGGDRLVRSCSAELPYPAKRVGYYVVTCNKCQTKSIVSTAGRPDDPRSVRLACKRKADA